VVESTGKVRTYDVGKKQCQDDNNRRNADGFARTKANNTLAYGDDSVDEALNIYKETNINVTEDALIEAIDASLGHSEENEQ
jgi:hypothetical protein